LVTNAKKCTFGTAAIEFPGHWVSAACAIILPIYVVTVQEFLLFTSVKELLQFQGLLKFYRRFLPLIAATLQPLMKELKGRRPVRDTIYNWPTWSLPLQKPWLWRESWPILFLGPPYP